MMKARLSISEKLTYSRIVYVDFPKNMTESEINDLLDEADRNRCMSASDYVDFLTLSGVKIEDVIDDASDSPDDAEVECEEYDPIDVVEE